LPPAWHADGDGTTELPERIDRSHAISASASAMDISHQAAGQTAESMDLLSEQPLVKRQAGGRDGGSSKLTASGHAHQ